MTKQSGLGDQLFISGVDIGADINAISNLSTPRETLPATNITQSAMARMFGKRDGQAEFIAYFNDDAASTHVTLKALPRTDVHLMYLRGTTLGNQSFAMVGKQVNYDPNRGDDGSFLFTVSAQANAYGADWCQQLTAGKITHSSAASGSTLDTTAAVGATAFGFQAYLQVFSLGSGTAELKIEDSANGTDWLDLTDGAFTNITASTVQRIQSSSATATVRRYLRVTSGGTFTNLVFAVGINKNLAARAL